MLDEKTLPPATSEPVVLDVPVPDHVPKHLVRDLRAAMGMVPNSLIEPYTPTERLLEDDIPPVMWSPFNFTHVTTGHWVVKSFKDCATIYQDQELCSTEGTAQFNL